MFQQYLTTVIVLRNILINLNLSFSFLALFHTNNIYAPWGGSDKRAKGTRAVGWCEAMSMLCCAIREVISVP